MRVLVFHNRYRNAGGEDEVVQHEVRMLRGRGAEVEVLETENPAPEGLGFWDQVRLASSAVWSAASHARARQLCREFQPDIAHVHNFWMKLSPSIHAACRECGVATVQTLHNFRLVCTNGLLVRKGQVCEDCLGKIPWRGVTRRCYRRSLPASAAVAGMIVMNRAWATWRKYVDAFITPSEHARQKLLGSGVPPERLFVKPNFVEDPGATYEPPSSSRQVIYVGRLSEEKGVDILLAAWAELATRVERARLLIVGDGPAAADLHRQAEALGLRPPQVVFTGRVSWEAARQRIGQSRLLVAPSRWIETFGNTVIEAFAAGRPAVVSDIGALNNNIDEGRTGLKCRPADPHALAEAITTLLSDAVLADRLGENARRTYLSRYTPQANYRMLMNIYRFAIQSRHGMLPVGWRPLEPEVMS